MASNADGSLFTFSTTIVFAGDAQMEQEAPPLNPLDNTCEWTAPNNVSDPCVTDETALAVKVRHDRRRPPLPTSRPPRPSSSKRPSLGEYGAVIAFGLSVAAASTEVLRPRISAALPSTYLLFLTGACSRLAGASAPVLPLTNLQFWVRGRETRFGFRCLNELRLAGLGCQHFCFLCYSNRDY